LTPLTGRQKDYRKEGESGAKTSFGKDWQKVGRREEMISLYTESKLG
jgi:hypothetical protein